MLSEKIIRAWKDLEYRLSLSDAERAQLPEHPAGLVELTEKELSPVVGGNATFLPRFSVLCTVAILCVPKTAICTF
jgi:mersacidin/lichenicidin family type 2 lantibiotic